MRHGEGRRARWSCARVRAPAKVNLSLRVVGRRPDGYHDIESLMVPIDVADEVVVRVMREGAARGRVRITLHCRSGAPRGRANLAWRAARMLVKSAPACDVRHIDVRLRKVIPAGRGLGGGSSDAAAVLRALHCLLGLGWSTRHLERLGAAVGADVPFFVRGRPARVGGVGDRIRPLARQQRQWVVVVVPRFGISTRWAYGAWDAALTRSRRASSIRLPARGESPSGGPVGNDFEPVVFQAHPELAAVKAALLAAGARTAGLTGTGSAVAATFRTRAAAQAAGRSLQGWVRGRVWVARTLWGPPRVRRNR